MLSLPQYTTFWLAVLYLYIQLVQMIFIAIQPRYKNKYEFAIACFTAICLWHVTLILVHHGWRSV